MKKVGKTTRPFRYDLNQIPYDYTVEVTNRFKELDLIDRVPEELWMEVCDIVQEAVIKTIPKKKKCKKSKWLWEEALQIAEKRREGKSKLEKERYTHLNAEFQIIVKAQTVKRRPAMWETQVRSLGQEDPLEKEMATHSSILAWKIPWMEPGRLQSMGSQRVGHN